MNLGVKLLDHSIYVDISPTPEVIEMKVNSGQDFLYLLYEDNTLKSLRLIEDQVEIDANGASIPVPFEPEILCRTIDVSPIGVLWCVKLDGKLFFFDAFERQWIDSAVSDGIKSELAKAKKLQVTLNTMEWIHEDHNKMRRIDRLNGKYILVDPRGDNL